MSTGVRIDLADRVATLTVDSPPLNILDLDLLAELEARADELAAMPDLQLVFVRGAGDKAFSAGVSIQDHTPDKIDRMLLSFHGALRRLRELEAWTVALVHGHCLGGGLELASVCDYLVATERARFGQPEIQLGCFPPVAAALLPGRIGAPRTLELLLTGRTVNASEALALGLVHEVVADTATLDARAEELSALLRDRSAVATRLTKRAVRAGEEVAFSSALAQAERLYLDTLAKSPDMEEGIAAFLEKRAPRWGHR